MKHVRTEVLQPGMVVASDVISKGNQLIFPKGYVLTEKALSRLETYDIRDIRIEDPVGIEVEEITEEELNNAETPEVDSSVMTFATESLMSALTGLDQELIQENMTPEISVTQQEEPSHFEKLKASREFQAFKQSFSENVEGLRDNLNDIVEKHTPIDVDKMIGDTMRIISAQGNTFGVFDMLHNMRDFDDLTYAHSMNVAMICNVFARWLGFDEDNVKLATACGMMHDIGKLKIPDSIIKKPGKLTDEEFMAIKSHPKEPADKRPHQALSPGASREV